MLNLVPLQPVDYLVIGHLSCDQTPEGLRLGGTAAYAALTGRALGLRVGVVTAWAGEIPLNGMDGVQVHAVLAEHSTSFENVYTPAGRIQIVHHPAPDIRYENIPPAWRNAPIVHLGPIAGEGKSLVDGSFPASMLGLTPQGWLRSWDASGCISIAPWPEARQVLPKANAAVLSIDDVGGNEDLIDEMAHECRVLALTEGPAGSRLYWNGDLRRFSALSVEEMDSTGAGDIFAAAFFWRLSVTHDPWVAGKFATHLASYSVTRRALEGIPTRDEIQNCLVEVVS